MKQEELKRLKDAEDKTETIHAMEIELKVAQEKFVAYENAALQLQSELQEAEAAVARVPQLETELQEVREKLLAAEASVAGHKEPEDKIRDLEGRLARAEADKDDLDEELFDREKYVNLIRKNVQVPCIGFVWSLCYACRALQCLQKLPRPGAHHQDHCRVTRVCRRRD